MYLTNAFQFNYLATANYHYYSILIHLLIIVSYYCVIQSSVTSRDDIDYLATLTGFLRLHARALIELVMTATGE